MTINTSRIDLMAGMDEAVANQRVRAYVPGDPFSASVTGDQQYGTLWMQGTGTPHSFSSLNGATTLTAAILGDGIILHQVTTATTDTTDSATNLQTYMQNNSGGIQVGDILQSWISNTGSVALTVSAGASVSLDANGVGVIPASTSKQMLFRCTAIGASPGFVLYM